MVMQQSDDVRVYDISVEEEQRLPLPHGWVSTLNAATRLRVYRNHEKMYEVSEHPYLVQALAVANKRQVPSGWVVQEAEIDGQCELYYCHPLHRWSGWDHPLLRNCLSNVLLQDKHMDAATAVMTLAPVPDFDKTQRQEPNTHLYEPPMAQHDLHDGGEMFWDDDNDHGEHDREDDCTGYGNEDDESDEEGFIQGDIYSDSEQHPSDLQAHAPSSIASSMESQLLYNHALDAQDAGANAASSLPGYLFAGSYNSDIDETASSAPRSAPMLESTATLRLLRSSGWYRRGAGSVRSTSKHSIRPTMSTTAKSRSFRMRFDSHDQSDSSNDNFESLTLKEKQDAFVEQLRETDRSVFFTPWQPARKTAWLPNDTSFLAPKKSDKLRDLNLPEHETLYDQQMKFITGLRSFSSGDSDSYSNTNRSHTNISRSRRRLRTLSNPPVSDASQLLESYGVRVRSSTQPVFDEQPLQDLDFVLARVQAAMAQPSGEPNDQISIPPSDLTVTTQSAGNDDTRSLAYRDSTFYSEHNTFQGGAPTTISSRPTPAHGENQDGQFDSLTRPQQTHPQLIQKKIRVDDAQLASRLAEGFFVNKYGRNKRAQKRTVRYNLARDALVWGSRKVREGVPLAAITSIHKGLASDILHGASGADPNRCLSIHCLNRTLDLETPTQYDRELLYRCVQACVERSNNRRQEL